jgi:hypothetical protein
VRRRAAQKIPAMESNPAISLGVEKEVFILIANSVYSPNGSRISNKDWEGLMMGRGSPEMPGCQCRAYGAGEVAGRRKLLRRTGWHGLP